MWNTLSKETKRLSLDLNRRWSWSDARPDSSFKKECDILYADLDKAHQKMVPLWRDARDYIVPFRGNFSKDKDDFPVPNWNKIIDGTGTHAAYILRAAMTAGLAGPQKPWQNITLYDQKLAEEPEVKRWLYSYNAILRFLYLRSTFYKVLPTNFLDSVIFGTGLTAVEESIDDIIHYKSLDIGQCRIGVDYEGKIDKLGRHYKMNVGQIVDKFGTNPLNGQKDFLNISERVKGMYLNQTHTGSSHDHPQSGGNKETYVEIRHIVKPNKHWNKNKKGDLYRRYLSVYYEYAGADHSISATGAYNYRDSKFLSIKGTDFFPILGARIEPNERSPYALNSPAITALPDVKSLQALYSDVIDQSELMVRPPMNVPTSLDNQKVSIVSGDVTYSDYFQGQNKIEPILSPALNHLEPMRTLYVDLRTKIEKHFWNDVVMPFMGVRKELTKYEAEKIDADSMFVMSHMVDQYNYDFFSRNVDVAHYIAEKRKLIPPPPPSIQGMDLKIEFISPMAKSQKVMGLDRIERFMMGMMQYAQIKPEIRHKINAFELVDVLGDTSAIPPELINDDETANMLMQQEMQQQMAMAQAQQQEQESKAIKNLAGSEVKEDNALGAIMGGAA